MKYCLPIQLKRMEDVSSEILTRPEYDLYEVWLDYIEDLKPEFVKALSSKHPDKVLFLFRRLNLETPKLSADLREKLLVDLSSCKAWLDLDIFNQAKELESLKEKGSLKLIVSYHNYSATPSFDELSEILSKMERFRPEIFKIATFCRSEDDSHILLKLLLELKGSGKRFIVLGMGANGQGVRIMGSLAGNEFIFAPYDLSKSTASGQLTREQYVKLFELVSSK